MNIGLALVAFVAAWMVAGVILATAFGSRLRRCADAATSVRHEVVLGRDRRAAEPLRWILPASIVSMVVASSTGLAAAGVLPRPVQVVARSVLGTVGLDVPDPPERYTAVSGDATPVQVPPAGTVAPTSLAGPQPGAAGGQTRSAGPETGRSSDPQVPGLAGAVAEHLAPSVSSTLPTGPGQLPPARGVPQSPPASTVPPAAGPADRPEHGAGGQAAVPGPSADAARGRPPQQTTTTRPDGQRPGAPTSAPTDGATTTPAVPAVPQVPATPAIPAAPTTTAPTLPPPAPGAPGEAATEELSPAELAKRAREERHLAKAERKSAKQVEEAPAVPTTAVDPLTTEPVEPIIP